MALNAVTATVTVEVTVKLNTRWNDDCTVANIKEAAAAEAANAVKRMLHAGRAVGASFQVNKEPAVSIIVVEDERK